MLKVLFVCHGNICRSPMAEFVFRDMLKNEGLGNVCMVASAATSFEEIGNSVHHGTRRKLESVGISVAGKVAVHMEKSDYREYDFIIGMDNANIRNILKITGGDPDCKVSKLLAFADDDGDIADPWYTGNFDITYNDVVRGCKGLLAQIKKICLLTDCEGITIVSTKYTK